MVVRMALPPCASWRRVATRCIAVVLSNPANHECRIEAFTAYPGCDYMSSKCQCKLKCISRL